MECDAFFENIIPTVPYIVQLLLLNAHVGTHVLLDWQQCQQSQRVCVSLPHGREPAHTDTAMPFYTEIGTVVRDGKANRHGTPNPMFWYISCILDWTVDGTVTSKLKQLKCSCCMKEEVIVTSVRHVSEYNCGNERCIDRRWEQKLV